MTEREFIANYCLADTLNFTRHFFLKNNEKRFLVGMHHQLICDKLNEVIEGKCKRLIINIAPRHGKTEIAVKNFIAYALALNPKAKFIHLSYSQNLALDNSICIKDIIKSEHYQELFPYTQVKAGSDTKARWDTTEGGGVYATSTLGQITGFGAGAVEYEGEEHIFNGAIIIDDPIKPEDALSDVEREKVNRRFETTIRNRVNSRNTPIIIIMQRLHEHDLCGYLQEVEPDTWDVLSLPCVQVDEQGEPFSLWPDKFTLEELYHLKSVDPFVFETQYMQNPKPLEGLMYRPFKTYEIIPYDKKSKRICYVDPADTGSDWLCAICYVETPHANYVTDVLFTKKPMEYTEPLLTDMLIKNEIIITHIERNGAGGVFSRNVEKMSREKGNTTTMFHTFAQTKNKQVRIFSRANEVNNITIFPWDWEHRWPEFAQHVKGYRREGVNAHDDGVDALTGTLELRGKLAENAQKTLINQLL